MYYSPENHNCRTNLRIKRDMFMLYYFYIRFLLLSYKSICTHLVKNGSFLEYTCVFFCLWNRDKFNLYQATANGLSDICRFAFIFKVVFLPVNAQKRVFSDQETNYSRASIRPPSMTKFYQRV